MPPPVVPSRGGPGRGFAQPVVNRSGLGGKGLGKSSLAFGARGTGLKIVTDTIKGISAKPDIRRLARRGGVKRISGMIYEDTRAVLKQFLENVLRDCAAYVEYRRAKTVTVHDVLHALARIGRPIYGFDPDTYTHNAAAKRKRLGERGMSTKPLAVGRFVPRQVRLVDVCLCLSSF
ncbi:hypothetical protein GE09DRAFT_1216997 [Coniochaeta sp. 2T2.1]|nr:hypothetical protein GE09DRAFT_1216997 [Coniochaeta sp. 2T2.1]